MCTIIIVRDEGTVHILIILLVWDHWYGTTCMVPLVWYHMYGTTGMVPHVWYHWYGTTCMVPLGFHLPSSTQSFPPLFLPLSSPTFSLFLPPAILSIRPLYRENIIDQKTHIFIIAMILVKIAGCRFSSMENARWQ